MYNKNNTNLTVLSVPENAHFETLPTQITN